ncbi:MAG: electron transfer flavoprotein subunit alpha/FixB family protein [Chloroflexi bacterium]|nr:electron transfer flavoprotein subunit alpha/FixB family protein [Chloroflexota bacterium]
MDFSYLDSLVAEEMGPLEEAGEGYRHIWVVLEARQGGVSPASLALLGKARDLADSLGVYLYAILLGEGVEALGHAVIPFGPDKVWVVDGPHLTQYRAELYTHALAELVRSRKPEIVLFGASAMGSDLAPRLAQRLGTGLLSHCVDLDLDMAERQLVGTCPVMGGRYFEQSVCGEARPQLATVEPGQFAVPHVDPYRSGEVERVEVDLSKAVVGLAPLAVEPVDFQPAPQTLAQARVIVAGGRGMGSADQFALLENLARALGGQVAGSRGAQEMGWITETQQLGVVNPPVAPKLYLACGISGSVYHYFGVRDAGFTVAVNQDPQAAIFKVANVGVVADASAVVQELLKLAQGEG